LQRPDLVDSTTKKLPNQSNLVSQSSTKQSTKLKLGSFHEIPTFKEQINKCKLEIENPIVTRGKGNRRRRLKFEIFGLATYLKFVVGEPTK
jgi:hypothetical protein